jgi:glyoxylase-like metal-dependent hydrolase (beta-lactamase superfamily II)
MPWHTVKPIDDDTYLITEPMAAVAPQYGIETANAHLLLGDKRAALIDSAMGIGDIAQLVRSLTPLPCMVLNTHSHWDHSGGNAGFPESAIHELEARPLEKRENMQWLHKRLRTPEALAVLPQGFDIDSFDIPARPATSTLRDSDVIDLGGREIIAIHAPGHSPGHMVFLEQARRTLYAGDIAYRGPVYACFRDSDPDAFLVSLRRLTAMRGVDICSPAHNGIIREPGWLNAFAAEAESAISTPGAGRLTSYPFPARVHSFGDSSLWLPTETS